LQWVFEDNLTHNCTRDGVFVWRNDQQDHVVTRFVSYRVGSTGIEHGAYSNCFHYTQCKSYESGGAGLAVAATSHPDPDPDKRLRFSDCIIGAGAHYPVAFTQHVALPPCPYMIFENCQFRSTGLTAINLNERPDVAGSKPGRAAFMNCTFNGAPLAPQHFQITGMHADSSYVIGGAAPKELVSPWHDLPPDWTP
jgi:hypothetical protein